MGRLDQKVAVITGSATGIGQATALVFAEQGATVVCADVSLEKAQQTVEQITQQGGKAEAVHVDVSDVDSVEQLAKHIKETRRESPRVSHRSLRPDHRGRLARHIPRQ